MEADIDKRVDQALQALSASSRGTLYEAIAKRYDQLVELKSMGHSLQTIARALTDAGVPITGKILQVYLKRVEASGRKPKKSPALIAPAQNQDVHRDPEPRVQRMKGAAIKKEDVTQSSLSISERTDQKKMSPSSQVSTSMSSGGIKRNDEDFPQTPTDWPIVRKRINGEDVELYRSPKYKLYSVLPGIDPDAPYGRNEAGVSYNEFGAPTWSMIGKGFIGEDL